MERFIAIDDVCAWPNLTLLPDNSVVATIFNQPCHGLWEGDVECWRSADGGLSWQRIGMPGLHEPGTNRMNVAAGLTHDDSLVVIASGWSPKAPCDREPPDAPRTVLIPWVCRSTDGGRSWERTETVAMPSDIPPLIPFGDIVRSPDGGLGASFRPGDLPCQLIRISRSATAASGASSTAPGRTDRNTPSSCPIRSGARTVPPFRATTTPSIASAPIPTSTPISRSVSLPMETPA